MKFDKNMVVWVALGIAALLVVFSLLPSSPDRMSTEQTAKAPLTETPAHVFHAEMSEAEVAAEIRRQVPELNDASVTYAQKIEAVRTWLHGFLPVGDRLNNLELLGTDHHNDSLGHLLYLAEARIGGYYCGPIAEISRRVYTALGFDAISLNFRVTEPGVTHILTLVRLPELGERSWTLQDTYFDSTLRDQNGDYLDFETLLELLEVGDTRRILVDEPDSRTPALHVLRNKEIMPRMGEKYGFEVAHVRDFEAFAEYAQSWDFRLLVLMFDLHVELEQTLGTNNPLYLFAFPLSNSGQDEAIRLMNLAMNAQQVMIEKFNANRQAYASTRVDAQYADDFARIAAWPKEDNF